MNSIFRTAKIIWLGFWAVFATLLIFFPVMTAVLMNRTGKLAFNMSKLWAWIIIKVSFVKIDIKNKERIEKGRSYIIISNHQSLYDIPVLVTKLGIQYRWIIKKELLKVPLFGYGLYASRNIFINRSNMEKAVKSINKGMDRLPHGVSVMFFAEGTRSPDGKIQGFKKGGFATAVERGLPILPVTVNGSRKILPKKSLAFNPGSVEVVIGRPIETCDYGMDRLDELVSKTRDIIVSNFNADYPEN